MSKYACTSCGVVYGSGPNTVPKPGYCMDCWELYLMTMRFNWQKHMLEERRRRAGN